MYRNNSYNIYVLIYRTHIIVFFFVIPWFLCQKQSCFHFQRKGPGFDTQKNALCKMVPVSLPPLLIEERRTYICSPPWKIDLISPKIDIIFRKIDLISRKIEITISRNWLSILKRWLNISKNWHNISKNWHNILKNWLNISKKWDNHLKQEESARERALCQLTECFWFVMVIMRGKHNYQGKGCTEIQ